MPEQPRSERRTQNRTVKQGMMQELLTGGKTRLVSRGDAENAEMEEKA